MTIIPSYDDLTPGIPDVIDSEAVAQLTLFLARTPAAGAATTATANAHARRVELAAGDLFACLRLRPAPGPTANSVAALVAVARDFSPRVMVASDVDVLLDVAGLGRLIGEPPEIARQLARAMYDAGLTASVALAPTQTAARLLATQMPDYPLARLPDLAIGLLRPLEMLPPGISQRDRARPYEIFEAWGIATLGELAVLPAADLSSRLGRRGVALQRLARGLDAAPFVPDGETPRFIGRLELEWPLDTLEPLSFVLARLLEPLSAALERADRGAAAIRLELRLTDRSTHVRLLQLPAPMRDPRVLRTLLLLALEAGPPAAAVDVVTIELDPAPARITQFSLLQRALPSPETLSTLTARLSALVGDTRVGAPVLLDTHEPGAFTMTRYAPENRTGNRTENPRTGEPGTLLLRRQRLPPAIRVTVEHGRPVHVAAPARGLPHGAVVQAAGPWRASGGWWAGPVSPPRSSDDGLVPPKPRSNEGGLVSPKRSNEGGLVPPKPPSGERGLGGEGGPVPPKPRSGERLAPPQRGEGGWNRDEWDVALADGAVCRIFQDRRTDRWFLDGVYD